jgi:protein SCO1/2
MGSRSAQLFARRVSTTLLAAAVCCGCVVQGASAQLIKKSADVEQLRGVGITDKRGDTLPSDLTVTDTDGNPVALGEFFDDKRPVLLVMAYYDCPMLCTLVLNGVQDALGKVNWSAGKEFRVVTISFDHTNTTQMAREKQSLYLAGYDRPNLAEDAWTFYTADAEGARAVADAVGFGYRFLPESGEYSHPAALIFLTPDGRVHNYLENIEYDPRDVKLALLEASQGKQGSLFDRVSHFCFVYDPDKGHYVLAMNVMRTGGLLTMILLGSFVSLMVWRGAVRRRGLALRDEPQFASEGAGG